MFLFWGTGEGGRVIKYGKRSYISLNDTDILTPFSIHADPIKTERGELIHYNQLQNEWRPSESMIVEV